MRVEVNVNKTMFTWAITRAGYELDDFINKFPNVRNWLDDTKKPTVKQLEAFSKTVHLPFGYLLLSEPPQEPIPIPFFRTNNASTSKISINVYDTILLLQQRQNWLKEYLLEHEFAELAFVNKYNQSEKFAVIVDDIRKTLELEDEWASKFKNWEDALDFLSERIEEQGIIIVFNGVVENNNYRSIDVNECRGFVLVDNLAPFMFVNNADSKSAQLFTIVHELAHIWIGYSAGFDNNKLLPANNKVELLCDAIAAEFLVPEKSLKRFWKTTPDIKKAARYFKVSEIVIARRALDLGFLTKKDFFNFYENYSQKEIIKKENQGGGGDFYATTKKRLSLTFAAHVNKAVKSGELLYRDAYKLTSLKGDTYQTFFKKHF